MAAFTDTRGRAWLVEINVALERKVRSLTGVNLYELTADGFKPLEQLLADPSKIVDVIFVLCQKQAQEAQMTDEQFAEGLGGETLDAMQDAFLEALANFTQDQNKRKALRKIIDMTKKATAQGSKFLDGIDTEQEVNKLIASLTKQPASSGLTQDHSPSVP